MNTKNQSTRASNKIGEPNRDPITGEPGAHPVGTGVGAAAGGATGAALGAAGGPVGAVVGTIIGAVAGGLAGKGVAEKIDPTLEEAYWRENHARQPYAKGRGYDEYETAYRAGIAGYANERTFEDRERELREAYESQTESQMEANLGAAADRHLEWDEARHATRAAYDKLANRKSAATGARSEPIPVAP